MPLTQVGHFVACYNEKQGNRVRRPQNESVVLSELEIIRKIAEEKYNNVNVNTESES